MRTSFARVLGLCALLLGPVAPVAAATGEASARDFRAFGLPPGVRPTVVRAGFELQDINAIDDGQETLAFSGVLTLTWQDPRNAFDPAVDGVSEKIFVGDYQFNEIAPGWYPQLVLVNDAGMFQHSGVVQRVRPDGTSTIVQTVTALAETRFTMYRFPFDQQQLEAVFEVLGFDRDEIVLEVVPSGTDAVSIQHKIPQWTVRNIRVFSRDEPATGSELHEGRSALVLGVDVERDSFYAVRLVVLPLIVIVLLSFSVFWMDRASLGDRLNVSFIGILTAVAYQLVTSEQLPRIAYVTLMHGFLSISFMTMCATVVVSLAVSFMDRRGKRTFGDVVDRRCRWAFPLGYFGILGTQLAIAFLLY